MSDLGGDEARQRNDHSLALGGEGPGILQRELSVLDDLRELGEKILLVHFSYPFDDALAS